MGWGDRIVLSDGHRIAALSDDRPCHDTADALFTITRRWPGLWKAADYHLSATSAVRCFRQKYCYLAVTDVADILVTSQSSASRAIDRAVGWGFLSKQPARMDARGVAVHLTDRGSAYLHDTVRDEKAWLLDAMRRWPGSDRAEAERLLLRLADDLRRTGPPPV